MPKIIKPRIVVVDYGNGWYVGRSGKAGIDRTYSAVRVGNDGVLRVFKRKYEAAAFIAKYGNHPWKTPAKALADQGDRLIEKELGREEVITGQPRNRAGRRAVIYSSILMTVGVKFDRSGSRFPSKEYHYLYDGNRIPVVGGLAVVYSPLNSRQELVTIESVYEGTVEGATKYLTDIVDVASYDARREKFERRAAITRSLDAIEKRMTAEERYVGLAARNPEAAALLAELKEIG